MIDSSRIGCAIYVPGMSSYTLEPFVVDDKWFLHHLTTENLFIPFVLPDGWKDTWDEDPTSLSGDTASFDEAVMLANCISYDHEVPTVVQPFADGRAPSYDAVGFPRKWIDPGKSYAEALITASEAAVDVRFTDCLRFRYSDDSLNEFGGRFQGKAEPLAMYGMALRQVDLLAEYLCLYRICEWADGVNGKKFINNNVDAIAGHDFGELWLEHLTLERERPKRNVFEEYQERAVGRLEALRTGGEEDIGKYLYGFRNGLAHGKSDLLVQDFGASVDRVAQELPLLRLLCRLAIAG
ncbi:methylamine utilization protein MauJ [Lentzea flava]|uniref:Apea-like HEPN domain-containing protein n=1 Tax=Lentzea flava TaxID=103732 RepID=A0ABQ2UKZ8_9PSEU|nr:methylamine utilization protein MauJ [Lentzea flava]MCP2199966.1 hypothetical protein [Lentzea flava]GGU39647.1 hypothetical protein GCM10010178_34950 [Lentzea flava]